uniref:Uncharacterized protein n=1 Tax=Panagrolaimus sp. ES5 TaxID=591445 RepID=A0AC34FST6_9BILA
MDVIKLDILRLNHLSLICANVSHPDDPEAVTIYLNHVNKNIEKIARRTHKFAKNVLDKAYPQVIVEAAKKFLGPNPLPHSVFNDTAEKIRKELDDRDVEEWVIFSQ